MKNICCNEPSYPSHSSELPRLNRVSGQIGGIKKMITEGQYCPNILAQLKAVRSAIKTIEADILHRHLHGCVRSAIQNSNEDEIEEKLDEIKKIFKRFED